TRGCNNRSSHSSSARSANTISAMCGRSVVPKRSSRAARTCGSSAISRWTMSSAEHTAAPPRSKASRASLFPAPIPPVRATLRVGLGLLRSRFGLCLQLRVHLGIGLGDGLRVCLGDQLRLGNRLGLGDRLGLNLGDLLELRLGNWLRVRLGDRLELCLCLD